MIFILLQHTSYSISNLHLLMSSFTNWLTMYSFVRKLKNPSPFNQMIKSFFPIWHFHVFYIYFDCGTKKMKTNTSKKNQFLFGPVRVYLNFSTGGRIILHICKVLLEEKIRHWAQSSTCGRTLKEYLPLCFVERKQRFSFYVCLTNGRLPLKSYRNISC